ncbi:MAG: ABC transporter ATP-binding protein [Planctomycetales bacterium]|nr:ABC transporter ATP-binding protein [Planctomycetales bacterium]
MTPPIVIETCAASMSYAGQTVLSGVDLRCAAGEFVSLLGPSGCGKSTLLRMAAGLEQPTSGSVRIGAGGRSLDSEGTDATSFVFQDPNLLPWRDVWHNVALPLEIEGMDRKEQRRRIADSLRLVGLHEADARKYPHALSGGMRMRASLARALVTRPSILLLDEPFAALDDMLRTQLNEELLALWQRENWTVLFVTHNIAEAVFLSNRIVVLGGKPSRCVAEIEVPLPHPRDRTLRGSAEFARLTAEVSASLFEASA